MDPTEEQLQKILESLPAGEWENPHIFSYNEEYRMVHTLVATKPGTGEMYYYVRWYPKTRQLAKRESSS